MSKFKKTYDEAITACKDHNMVLARLETKKEHDDLIFSFKNSVPGRAYVGISLLGGNVIQHESKIASPYNIVFRPGNPSGDGTCLEILRGTSGTAINDLSCDHIHNFICETKGDLKKIIIFSANYFHFL